MSSDCVIAAFYRDCFDDFAVQVQTLGVYTGACTRHIINIIHDRSEYDWLRKVEYIIFHLFRGETAWSMVIALFRQMCNHLQPRDLINHRNRGSRAVSVTLWVCYGTIFRLITDELYRKTYSSHATSHRLNLVGHFPYDSTRNADGSQRVRYITRWLIHSPA